MNSIYTLAPTNTVYDITKHFPAIPNDQKIGVFLSGGMESSLISLIASELYGKDRVIFFFSDDIFSSKDPARNTYIRTNLNRAANLLDIEPTYLEFDYEAHITDRRGSIERKILELKEKYNVGCVMFGFTKLFFEVEVFRQDGMTKDQVRRIAYGFPEKYKSTIEEFHLATDRYTDHLLTIDIPPEVYPLLRDSEGFIRSPFKDLNKSEVVDFYKQLGMLDILYGTSSCIRESLTAVGKHCGKCFNCQQRWDAFRILGTVKDKTEYANDDVKHHRDEIENAIHS